MAYTENLTNNTATSKKTNNGSGFLYTLENLGLGIMRGVEGVTDFLVGGAADLFGDEELADEVMKNDWINYNHANEWYNPSGVMQTIGQISQGVGAMLPSIATAAAVTYFTGGTAAPAVASMLAKAAGGTMLFAQAAGQATSEAAKKSGTAGSKEWLYGIGSGAAETAVEALSGGVGGIAAGTVLGKQVAKSTLGKLAVATVGEGLEEVASDIIDPHLKYATGMEDKVNIDWKQMPNTFLVGAGVGGVLGGRARIKGAIKAGGFNNLNASENAQELTGRLTENNTRQAEKKKLRYTEKDIQDTARRLSKNLQKMKPEQRKAYMESNSFMKSYFAEDGTLLNDANGSSTATTETTATNKVAPVTYSASLRGRENTFAYQPAQTATEESRNAMDTVTRITQGKAEIVLTDQDLGKTADGQTINGEYRNGVIYLNSKATSEQAVRFVAQHEMAHTLEGTQEYTALGKYISEYIKKNPNLAKKYDVERYTLAYANTQQQNLSTDTLIYQGQTEMYADFIGKEILKSQESVNRLANRDANIVNKFLSWVKTAIQNLGKSKAERAEYKELRRMEKMLAKALETARGGLALSKVDKIMRENEQQETQEETAKPEVSGKPAEARASLSSMELQWFPDKNASIKDFENRSYKNSEEYKKYIETCVANMIDSGQLTKEEEAKARKQIEKSIDGIVDVAVAMKKAGYDILDVGEHRKARDSKKRLLFSSLEPNSDYFTSHDISTICDKRKNFAEIYDEIVAREEKMGIPKGKRFFANVDNYFVLHDILASKGLTAACKQCYVESMRKNLAPMANAFLELMQEKNASNRNNKQLFNTKGEAKVGNTELRENLLKTIAEEEYDITADDLTIKMLTTASGLAQLKIQAPLIYEAFNSFYGQSKPKMPRQAVPFRFGELSAMMRNHNGTINQTLVKKINSTGGFRLQSYSDFQIENWADVLQVIFEAGTLGLNGHAYTKVPAFLDATEGTNLKRNISVFMYKDTEIKGVDKWRIDKKDSFPAELNDIYAIVQADASGNTGIIAVSQNDDMSAWIMANDMIAYGIPFHKSGIKMDTVRKNTVRDGKRVIEGYLGIKDHTRQQSEVWKKTEDDHKAFTRVKKAINIYEWWDFKNTENLAQKQLIEKNVKRYIDECEKAGYYPKFRDYVMDNDGIINKIVAYSKAFGDANATVDSISFEYKGYRIPYGYYKFLGDFGMFKPNGKASPQKVLSLANYDFKKAVEYFSKPAELRREEILQQFDNETVREDYRKSDLTAEQLEEIVKQKRKEVANEIIDKRYGKKDGESRLSVDVRYSLSEKFETLVPYTSEEIKSIQYSPNYSIAYSYNDIVNFIKASVNNENQTEFLFIGKFNDSVATFIEKEIGINIKGKSIVLSSDNLRHIFNKHGNIKKESDRNQIAITTANIEGVIEAIISPDKVAKETNNDGSISVLFEKQVNGRTLTITVLSNKKNTLTLKSARIFKTSISSPNDTNASFSTSKTMGGTRGSSDTIITEKTDLSSEKSKKVEKTDTESRKSITVTPQEDAEYMDAYFDGNDELMQEMVDKVAKRLGYKYKAYHHTENAFTVFDLSKARKSMDIQGFYFSADMEAESEYGSVRYDTYLKMENPYVVDSKETQNAIPFDMSKPNAGVIAREWLQEQGYDGVIRKAEYFGAEADEYIVFDSSQIKSAEPMTFEDDEYGEGDIIPLSKRFDTKQDDIRYSVEVGEEQVADEQGAEEQVANVGSIAKGEKALTKEEQVEKVKNRLGNLRITSQIESTNVQAGIEHEARRLGGNVEAEVQMARIVTGRAINALNNAQYNYKGDKRVGDSLLDIFKPIHKKGEEYTREFNTYLYHYHNVDRMSLESKAQEEIQKILKTDAKLKEIVERKDINETEKKRLIKKTENGKRYLELLEVKNKPVFGETVTSEDSIKEIAEIEKAHPEFKEIAEKVWAYSRNLIQYRVDAGLITKDLADLLLNKYSHYVPTYREDVQITSSGSKKLVNGVRVRQTIRTAKGGNQDLLDISLSLTKQTLEVYRAAAINKVAVSLHDLAEAKGDYTNVILAEQPTDITENVDNDYSEERPNNEVVFYKDGKRYVMAVNKNIATGFESFSSQKVDGPIMKALTTLNSGFKKLVTSANPLFLVRNALRDVQEALFYTHYGTIRFVPTMLKAYKQIFTKGELWQQYRAMGGSQSGYYSTDTGIFDARNKAKKGISKVLEKIGVANEVIEAVPRFTEFMLAMKSGKTVEQAMLESAEVTTNFSRGGKLAKVLNRTVMPFLNPSIQGFSKLWRTVTGKKTLKQWTHLIVKALIVGMSVGMLNDLINGDDEDYENLNTRDKENNYILGIGDGKFVKIPKGRVVAALGSIYPRIAAASKGDEKAFEGYFESVSEMVSPVDQITRTIFSPFNDAKTNTTWYGGQIEGQAMQNLAVKDRYDEGTSSIAIWIGQTFNVSPKKVHYLIDQYSGVIGDVILPLTNEKAEKDPFSAAFTIDGVSSNRISTYFYDMKDEMMYAKNGGDIYASLVYSYLNKVSGDVSEMYQQKRDIQTNKKLSRNEKLKQANIVQSLINSTQLAAMESAEKFEQALIDMDYKEMVVSLMKNKVYAKMDEDSKTKAATMLKNYSYAKAMSSITGEKCETKYYLYDSIGVNETALYLTKINTIKSDKDEEGKTIANSRKEKVHKYIEHLKLSKEQKYILMYLAGYTPTEKGKKYVENYLRKKSFTAKELEDLWE